MSFVAYSAVDAPYDGSVTTKLASAVMASAAFFAIAALAAVRGRREPLAARLAALCLILFAYTAFDLIGAFVPGQPAWDWLDGASAALAPAAFFHFTIAFLGRRSDLGRLVTASWIYFGAVAVACLGPLVSPSMARFPNGPTWAALILGGMAPTVSLGVVLLVRHARASRAEERARTALVFGCIVVAVIGTATDLTAVSAGMKSPGIASWALVASAALLAVTAFRVRAFERVPWLVGVNAAALALVVVLGELALFWGVGSRAALMAVGSAILVLLAILAGRYLFGTMSEGRDRAHADALLGRMSRQMAHDLRNPLAAIRGAAQYLQAERAAGRSLDEQLAYVDLVVEQADRMNRVIAEYQRLGRVEPTLAPVSLHDLARGATSAFGDAVKLDVAQDSGRIDADAELVTMALENVIRNAVEAGAKTIRVSVDAGSIVVDDDGPGMDARTRDRAFEEFYTTKTTGSGLGLAFVRRVAEAHGWRARIDSMEGEGTRVVIVTSAG